MTQEESQVLELKSISEKPLQDMVNQLTKMNIDDNLYNIDYFNMREDIRRIQIKIQYLTSKDFRQ